MLKRIARLLTAATLAAATLTVTPISVAQVSAAGTPDIELTKNMPAEVLLGSNIPVSLNIENTTGTDGYNMLIRDVLPAGVSYVSGSATPDPIELVQGDNSTVLIWSNIADSLDNTNVVFEYEIAVDGTFDVSDSVVNDAGAYVNDDPRVLPVATGPTGTPGNFTGNDTASASTLLIPFELTKTEPNTEDELLRGIHDHQTRYRLEIANNGVNPTTGFSVVDYIPAQLEFLGCGTADNSAAEEYTGSGPIPNFAPPLVDCVTPSIVTTETLDPDGAGPMPNGVYTRVEWTSADIVAARGSADLGAGGTLVIEYVAAIPLRENVDTDPAPAPATSNLDNNTGPLTTESETIIRNYAAATGDYNSTTEFTDDDIDIVYAEDVSIHKSVDSDTFIQGQTLVWTLDIESSEYATSTGPITVTDTLPATVDFNSAVPAPTSGPVLNANGTETYTWELPAFAADSSTATIVIDTTVREFYRDGTGGDGAAVAANDSFVNLTDLETVATTITDNDATTTDFDVVDESSASTASGSPEILKEVSVPQASLTCGDGTPVAAWDEDFAAVYRPGDTVCFRLRVDFPPSLDTITPVIQDFLPAGYAYVGHTAGPENSVPADDIVFTDDSPVLRWNLSDVDALGDVFQVVVETTVDDPLAAAAGDVLDNLMKMRYSNLSGGVFQLRDQALAEWSEPEVSLSKGVIEVNNIAPAGAPADGVTVQEGDVVTYQVVVRNDGTEDAANISVRDVLPTGIACADVVGGTITTGGVCDAANDWIQWDTDDGIAAAQAGGTFTLTYDVLVPTGISAGASLVNTAGVRSFTGETNTGTPFTYVPGNNIDSTLMSNTDPADDMSEIVTADPTIDKTRTTSITDGGNAANWQATVGETISYTVVVDIPAGLTYLGAEITDVLDGEKDLIAATVSATLDTDALPTNGLTLDVDDAANTWTVDFPAVYTVPNGADQQVVITFDALVLDVGSNDRGTSTPNTATFSFEDAAGIARNVSDSVGVSIVEPNIELAKDEDDADDIVGSGQEIEYTLSVFNNNTVQPGNDPNRVSTAYDTVVVDTVPLELEVLDASGGTPLFADGIVGPNGGEWDFSERTITWTIASIAPGATESLGYFANVVDPVVAGASIDNSAVATTTSMPGDDPNERTSTSPNATVGYDDTADDTVTVPEFTITKAADPAIATIGETVTYTLDVTLPAGLIGYDMTVIDQVPPGVTYESLTSIVCDEGGGACTPDVATADALVVPGGPYATGDDIAFFFDDLLVAGAGDRVVTITYVGYVSDTMPADDGATLTNSATLVWNDGNVITTPPTAVPDPTSFTETTDPASDSVGTVEPSLTIDKNVSGQSADTDTRRAQPGDVLTYTVTVTNNGTGPAYDATISDVPTDDTWAFVDTTATAGITNTDSDPVGGLEWTVDGPIAASGGTATVTYTLEVPPGYDSSNENPTGPEQTNVADVPSYFGVPETTRTANPDRDFREYDDVTPDTVTIELDLASIGDLVWFDVNGDGIRDAGEPGIADTTVTVTYLGPDGMLGGGDDETFTTQTDANGNYLVDDLPGGEYQVDVDEADPDFIGGLEPSFDLDGTTASPNGFWTGTLGEDEDKRDVDFGYTGTGSIGDTIYLDQNLDGSQNPGEDGLDSIDVVVTWLGPDGAPGGGDDIEYTATTDTDGMYLVDNLPAGNFTVAVDETDLPTGYVNVADPDTPGAPDSMSLVTLGDGSTPDDNVDLGQDFGYAGSGSIGDTIYLDFNGDGDQDLGEQGLENVTVELVHYGSDGVLGGTDDSFFTTVTGPGGSYLFDNLPYGNYDVTVVGGIALVDNTDDPDTPGVGDSMSMTTLTPAVPDDLDQDFGYFADSVLGDKIWLDLNGDGIIDADEPGLEGIEVTIDDPVSGLTFTTTTDVNGDYIFMNILDADWTVTVNPATLPGGLTQTFDFDGTGTPNESETTLVTSDLNQDFGYQGSGQIGDTVWLDLDADGTVNGQEIGLEGVTVTLEFAQPGGTPIVFTTTTDANGNYLFDNLPNGDYTVTVDTSTLPTGVVETFDFDGGADSTSGVTLADGSNVNLDQDFGYNGTGSIGDTVWFDRNGDGVLDPDETGLPGIDVTLVWDGPFGPFTFTTTTGPDGTYLFDNLPPGDYTVTVDTGDLPPGMNPTFDANSGNDSTSSLTLADGEDNLDHDFGYNGAGSIGDTIFLDIDGDGVQGLDEPGVPGQTVELTWESPNGPVTYTTTTGPDGTYLFDGLPPADYTVTVVGGIVDVATNTGDPGADGDSTNSITLADGEENVDQDFGYQGNNGLGDTVWLDLDADGMDDGVADEPRLEGVDVVVTWFGPDGVAGGGDDITMPTATTNSDGGYLVGSLPDGTYSVTVDPTTLPNGLDTNTFDADGGGTTGGDNTSIVTDLGVGTTDPQVDLDQDFGYTGTGSIGDTIWLDLNGDGIEDPNEPGIEGAEVTVTWAGPDGVFGTPDDVVYPTQTTDDAGNYLFENLPAGEFQVDVANLPAGVSPTSDPNGGDDNTSTTTLDPGEADLAQDFGYNGDASIGDTIWLDVDGDGVQDPNEPGVPGVTVTVTSPGVDGIPGTADDLVTTTTTDDNGMYLVDGLPPGTTVVTYDPATLPPDTTPNSDLDGGDLTTATVDLENGDDVRDVDFGVVGGATIEGTVWIDINNDGVQNPGEVGIPNVTVEVTWDGPDGPIVISVVTDDDGNWSIPNVPAGDYTTQVVVSTVPPELVPTTPTDGSTVVPAGGTGRVDNGFVPGSSIGDRVFEDTNGDGVQNPGEPGVPGVTITLTTPDGTVVGTTTTGPDGDYVFGDLPPGDYVITVDETTIPIGFVIVVDIDGSPDGEVSITLGPDEDRTDVDFGIAIPELPRTGLYIGMTLMVALGFLLAGIVLLGARRRRDVLTVS